MGNFVCGNDAAIGRSVMGCHNESADFMGEVKSGRKPFDTTKGIAAGKGIDTKNILNTSLAIINSGGSDYKAIVKPIANLDNTWRLIKSNNQISPLFPDDVWLPRIAAAWAETGKVFSRNTHILMTHYSQGLSSNTADQASAAASGLLNEFTALKSSAYPVTKATADYKASEVVVKYLVAKLKVVSNKLRAEGRATAEQAEITTARTFTELGERQKALEENDFPIVPIAIAGAAAIGAFLIFKG